MAESQIDRLAEAMDLVNARPHCRCKQQNSPYKHYIYTGRVNRNYANQESSYDKSGRSKGPMIETEEGILYTVADPEITITQEGHVEDKIIIDVKGRKSDCIGLSIYWVLKGIIRNT